MAFTMQSIFFGAATAIPTACRMPLNGFLGMISTSAAQMEALLRRANGIAILQSAHPEIRPDFDGQTP